MLAAWHSIRQWLSSRRRMCALGPGDLVISKPRKAFVRSERQGRECLKAKAVLLVFTPKPDAPKKLFDLLLFVLLESPQ